MYGAENNLNEYIKYSDLRFASPLTFSRCGRLEVSDEVLALSLFLDASEDHFGARNVLLGILQVLHQGLFTPDNPCEERKTRIIEPIL